MSRYLAEKADFVSDATYQGILYMIDYYPGVVLSNNQNDVVSGELFRLRNEDQMADLDQYEGIGDSFEKPYEYKREIVTVKDENDIIYKTWIYHYAWSVKNRNRISSGDFLKK